MKRIYVASLISSLLLLIALPAWADSGGVIRGATRAEPPAHFRVDTYTSYEMRLQKIETRWADARAVTTRQPGGSFLTVLYGADGREITQKFFDAPNPLVAEGSTPPRTVSGANEAVYREHVLKDSYRAAGYGNELLSDRVTMDFGDYISESVRDPKLGSMLKSDFFRTFLRDQHTGKLIGVIRWFADEQMLSWRFPQYGALGQGFLTPERLEKVGGWKTLPDVTWAGIQALVFRDSYEHVARDQGPHALGLDMKAMSCDGVSDGCTGLHWLDGTVYRACCDTHDLCYEYDPPDGCCGALSWLFPTSWHCAYCNIQVVYCFISAGGGGGGSPCPGGGGGGGGCAYDNGYCPPECSSCSGGGWMMDQCGY